MPKFRMNTLRHKLLGLFFVFMLVSSAAGFGVILEINAEGFADELAPGIRQAVAGQSPQEIAADPLSALRKTLRFRILVFMAAVQLAAGGGLLWLFRNYARPMEEILTVGRRMKDGDLNHSLAVGQTGEIGEIGELVNDFAVNMQEVLLLTWNQAADILNRIDDMEQTMVNRPVAQWPQELPAEISRTRQDTLALQEMIRTFEFFDVCLQAGKPTALDPTGPRTAP